MNLKVLQDAGCMAGSHTVLQLYYRVLRRHYILKQLILIDPGSSRQAMQFIACDRRRDPFSYLQERKKPELQC